MTRPAAILVLSSVFWLAPESLVLAQASQPTAFVNGHWFDGKKFNPGVLYSADGYLTRGKPSGRLETIDLAGGFVVPAFADAHNHLPASAANFGWANKAFLQAGVFYVLNPNDIAEDSNPLREHFADTTVEMAFSHGGFTCPGGHPKALYEGLIDRKVYSYEKPELEGRAFYSVDSSDDIERNWPRFLESKPDLVKLYLGYTEAYSGDSRCGKSFGLRPELTVELVRRAKSAGLRSAAHVESAEDFRIAVESGVNLIMHLPGYNRRNRCPNQNYVVSDADARLAASHRVMVVTTAALLDAKKDPQLYQVQIANVRRLKTAGVTFLVGSDTNPGNGALQEIEHLSHLGVFSNLELLKMWCETTPRAIFPARRIGQLRERWEASFVVLARDPLTDLSALREIRMRIKKGHVLN